MKNKIKLLPLLLVTATLVACGGGGSGGSSINGNPSDVGNPIEVVNPPIEIVNPIIDRETKIKVTPDSPEEIMGNESFNFSAFATKPARFDANLAKVLPLSYAVANNSSYQIKVTAVTNNNAQVESSPVLDFSLYTPVTNLRAVVENRFTVGKDAESECITDNLTGLMWPKDANLFKNDMDWNNALDAVAAMNGNNNSAVANNLCGYKDWHLPTVNELTSLVNYEDEVKLDGFLKNHGFSGVQAGGYWSSTSYAPNTNAALLVDFYGGDVGALSKTSTTSVWPVRRVM